MPKRSRSAPRRKNYLRRRDALFKRRRRRPVRVSTVRSRTGPIPPSMYVKMAYASEISITPGGAGLAKVATFRLNSIFDPDATNAGHQPYGHDTFEALYNRYRVHKVRFRIVAPAPNVTGTTYMRVCDNAGNTWDGSTPESLFERPRVFTKTINSITGTTDSFVVKPRNVTGVSALEYKDDRFQAAFGANPQENILCHFGHYNPGSAPNIRYIVKAIYYVECFDPKILPQS